MMHGRKKHHSDVFVFLSGCVWLIVINIEWFYHKLNSVALVRERTIPTERPPPVGEVSANFCR
jgi:hypothetical protein